MIKKSIPKLSEEAKRKDHHARERLIRAADMIKSEQDVIKDWREECDAKADELDGMKFAETSHS